MREKLWGLIATTYFEWEICPACVIAQVAIVAFIIVSFIVAVALY